MRALVVALALLPGSAMALDCAAFLGPAELQSGDVRALPGRCTYTDLVLDTGDGGLWTVPRAAISGAGVGAPGAPLRDIDLRIDNARQVSDDDRQGARTTAVLTAEKSGSDMTVDEFIVAMTGLGQIIATGRLLNVPDDLNTADPAAVLGVQADDLELTLEIENLTKIFAQFGVESGDAGVVGILRDLSDSFATLDGQDDSAAALNAVIEDMPEPQGRLRVTTGSAPIPLALFALAIATGNAAPLAQNGVRIAWTSTR